MFQQGHTRQKMPNKLLKLVKLRKKESNSIFSKFKAPVFNNYEKTMLEY